MDVNRYLVSIGRFRQGLSHEGSPYPLSCQPSLALELVGIQLRVRNAPPVVLLVELQARGASDFTLVQVYTTDLSLCDQYQGTPCSDFIAEVVGAQLGHSDND